MGLVAPLVLAGLAALAIPIALHLIQRERKRVVEFPSLMFLRRIPYQSVRRRRVRHWALLLLRLAALAVVVLAFARPFFKRPALAAATQNGAREVVILLDTSYSMGYGDRWTRARSAAADVVNGMGAGDRASLVVFNTGADALVRSTADRSQVSAAVRSAEPGPGATRFAPALKLAGSLLAESPLPRREIVLISDFQRRGWDASPGRDDVRLPARTTVRPINVAAGTAANLTVLPPTIERTRFENQDRVVVTVGVANHGDAAASRVPVTLEINGQLTQTQTADVAPHASASVVFAPFTVASRNMRGVLRLPDDGLARDNAAFFVVSPLDPVHVAIVNRPGAEREAFYVARALAIGDEPRADVVMRTPDTLADADLRPGSIVVLNDVPVSDRLAAQVQQHLARGGGLLLAAGPHATWPAAAKDVLPAMPAGIVDRTTDAAVRLGALEYSHPIFELFRAPRSGDFSAPRFYAYRAFETAPPRPLARFDDGAPALVDKKVGEGRVLVWASTLDLGWNDLPVKPVFLPFLHQSVRYLANFAEQPAFASVGQAVPAPRPLAPVSPRATTFAITPSGSRASLGSEDGAIELTEQGFYDIRTQGAPADSGTTIAANVDPAESDLTPIDPAELMTAITGRVAAPDGADGPRPTPEAEARAQRIWWYLLVAAGLLLAGETLLSNRLSQA
jgi:hypothetical protein